MSNMNKGKSLTCGGSQEKLAKHTYRTIWSYFSGQILEATTSQVQLQDSQPLLLLVLLAHIEEVGKPDISDHDELEEDI